MGQDDCSGLLLDRASGYCERLPVRDMYASVTPACSFWWRCYGVVGTYFVTVVRLTVRNAIQLCIYVDVHSHQQ